MYEEMRLNYETEIQKLVKEIEIEEYVTPDIIQQVADDEQQRRCIALHRITPHCTVLDSSQCPSLSLCLSVLCMYVRVHSRAQLLAKTSIKAMRALEERGGVIELAVQQLPKVQSGVVWINQTQLPQDTIDTLNRIMCRVWPERLYSRYIQCGGGG